MQGLIPALCRRPSGSRGRRARVDGGVAGGGCGAAACAAAVGRRGRADSHRARPGRRALVRCLKPFVREVLADEFPCFTLFTCWLGAWGAGCEWARCGGTSVPLLWASAPARIGVLLRTAPARLPQETATCLLAERGTTGVQAVCPGGFAPPTACTGQTADSMKKLHPDHTG